MSDYIAINDKLFHSVRSAAGHFSYSSDYVTRLAREKKITAVQLGRRWFVNLDSLRAYRLVQEQEQEIRQKHLREQRLRERLTLAQEEQLQQTKSTPSLSLVTFKISIAAIGLLLTGGLLGSWLHPSFETSVGASNVASVTVVSNEGDKTMTSDVSTAEALQVSFSNHSEIAITDDRSLVRPDSQTNWTHIIHE